MRRCSVCRVPKDEDCFNWKVKAKGWRLSTCKECQKAVRLRHYHNNPEPYKRRAKVHRDAVRAKMSRIVREAKNQPCADCGQAHPYYVMDLDHVRGTKKACVSRLLSWAGSIPALLEEIAKCDVVCANCHRERTHRQNEGASSSG